YVQQGMLNIVEALIRKDPAERVYRNARGVIEDLTRLQMFSSRALPALPVPGAADAQAPGVAPAPRTALATPAPEAEAAEPRRPQASIMLTRRGDGKRVEFPPERPVLVGRQADCQLVIADTKASRMHALLDCHADGRWWVYDLRSANGVAVNGKK